MIDAAAVRTHFPALSRMQDGNPVLYFDNPAGTQVPEETIEGFTRHLRGGTANVGGNFATSGETDEVVAQARAAMADFLNAPDPNDVVFGPNMTSLTFEVSHALSERSSPGATKWSARGSITTAMSLPGSRFQERGAVIRWIDFCPKR